MESRKLSQVDETLFENIDASESYFDFIIGQIEDILIDEQFQKEINSFIGKYCHLFDSGDENKLIYMEVYNEYIEMLEGFLNTYLVNRIPSFNMENFIHELEEKQTELNGEVFEILNSMTDFLNFKEMMLDYRDSKEGNSIDTSEELFITSYKF